MKKNEKTSSNNQSKTNNNKKNEVMKSKAAAKREKLTSPEQITQLANELGRKVSKQDLLNTFIGGEWGKDKQGRAQNLILNGQILRTDNKIFYPNAEKPEPTGKHLSGTNRTSWAQKVTKLFEAMQEAAKGYNIDPTKEGAHSVEQLATLLDSAAAKVEAAKVAAAAAKHTEKITKAAARFSVADLEKMLEARKAAANA